MRSVAEPGAENHLLDTDGPAWQPSFWDGVLFVVLHYGLLYTVLPAALMLLVILAFRWAEGRP